jgi:glycosyltransferase involved in cell wall biosynthesis
MRVLYVTHAFWPYIGGLEIISGRLLAGLRGQEFEFCVLTGSDDRRLPKAETWNEIPIRRLDLTGALTSRDAQRLAALRHEAAAIAREWDPDLVHLAFSPAAAFLTLGARMERLAPLLITFHGWWPILGEAGPTITRRALAAAGWVTACSQSTLDDVRRFEPAIAERSSWIPNALDLDGEVVEAPANGVPLVVGLGRLAPEKGYDVLVRAFAQVRRDVPEARLALAGRGLEEGPLTALTRDLGLEDAVDFLGWVRAEDVPALLDRATVVAVPSRHEGFGMAALEAALRARPVVASRTGGLIEVVQDGITGLLVAPEEPDELAAAIGGLLEDRERAAQLGRDGRSRARRLFSEERLLREHAQLYRQLVASGGGAEALEAHISSPP